MQLVKAALQSLIPPQVPLIPEPQPRAAACKKTKLTQVGLDRRAPPIYRPSENRKNQSENPARSSSISHLTVCFCSNSEDFLTRGNRGKRRTCRPHFFISSALDPKEKIQSLLLPSGCGVSALAVQGASRTVSPITSFPSPMPLVIEKWHEHLA